jgi:hypothetical protein
MAKNIVFIGLIVVGILLRVVGLGSNPGGLFADEAALAINAKLIHEQGTDEFGNSYPFGFESFSDYKMPGYIYVLSLFHFILPYDVVTVRVPAAIASITSIFLIMYLAHLLFPHVRYLSWSAGIVLALSPFHIHFGRIAYETMLATCLLMLYLVFLIRFLKNGKIRDCIGGSFVLLLACITYPAPRVIAIPLTITLLVYSLFHEKNTTRRKIYIYGLSLAVLVLGVSFLPGIRNPALEARTLGYVAQTGNNVLLSLLSKSGDIFHSWVKLFSFGFLFQHGDIYALRHGTSENGVFLPVFIIPFVVGIMYIVRYFSWKDTSWIVFVLLLISSGLPSALTFHEPYGPRVLPFIIPLVFIVAFGMSQILHVAGKLPKKLYVVLLSSVLVIVVFQVANYSHIYAVHFAQKSRIEFNAPSIEVARYIQGLLVQYESPKIYFLNGYGCLPWSHDELKVWYLLGLDNHKMIEWNKHLRQLRLATRDPFNAFDKVQSPTVRLPNLVINSKTSEVDSVDTGSYFVRCGYSLKDINMKNEEVVNIFYADHYHKVDPIYVVTRKIR